jgi:hypothetical protein
VVPGCCVKLLIFRLPFLWAKKLRSGSAVPVRLAIGILTGIAAVGLLEIARKRFIFAGILPELIGEASNLPFLSNRSNFWDTNIPTLVPANRD